MKQDPQSYTFKCPFCGYGSILAKPGKTVCQKCRILFEIDDRGECVFIDPLTPTLPMEGTFCPACGLLQDGEAEDRVLCKARLNREAH